MCPARFSSKKRNGRPSALTSRKNRFLQFSLYHSVKPCAWSPLSADFSDAKATANQARNQSGLACNIWPTSRQCGNSWRSIMRHICYHPLCPERRLRGNALLLEEGTGDWPFVRCLEQE